MIPGSRRSRLFVSANLDGSGVGGEALAAGEVRHVAGVLGQGLGVIADHAGGLEEIIGRQRAEKPRRPAGRQHVRRAGVVIAQWNRRLRSKEDRPGVADSGENGVVVLEKYGEEPRLGDSIEVVEGPLKRLKGVFKKEIGDKERVMILLNYVSYQGMLLIEKRKLKKTGPGP